MCLPTYVKEQQEKNVHIWKKTLIDVSIESFLINLSNESSVSDDDG